MNDCISHYPIWLALYKKVVMVSAMDDEMVTIAGDETNLDLTKFEPLRPISVFKHYQQFDYNRSMWGLDKNTEMSDLVFMLDLKVSFEAHYILRMICGIVVNTWRVAQARKIVQFLQKNEEDNSRGEPATIAQLRRRNENLTLTDYVLQVGLDTLKIFESSHYQRARLHHMKSNPTIKIQKHSHLTMYCVEFAS